MKIEDVGEFGLIKLIEDSVQVRTNQVILGIGDDCAVYRTDHGCVQLATTDMLVENVHFKQEWTTAYELGYKAAAVNISDVAAMGGLPRYVLVSLALPQGLPSDYITQFYRGMEEICGLFHISIIGGDTVKSTSGIIVNITLIGECEEGRFISRAGAKAGDMIVVTNYLGEAAAGLDLLQSGLEGEGFSEKLVRAHKKPVPQVEPGQIFSRYKATSMNDISDGLASELNEIASASKAGMLIYRERLPVSEELSAAAKKLGRNPIEYVLYGGEDYQLVFTMAPDDLLRMRGDYPLLSLTVVGEVKEQEYGVRMRDKDGIDSELKMKGYNHFGEERYATS